MYAAGKLVGSRAVLTIKTTESTTSHLAVLASRRPVAIDANISWCGAGVCISWHRVWASADGAKSVHPNARGDGVFVSCVYSELCDVSVQVVLSGIVLCSG